MFGPVLHPASRRKGVVKRHPPVTAAHASAVDLVKMRRIPASVAELRPIARNRSITR